MRSKLVTVSATALLILTGCTAFELKPLPRAHPAHPEAAVAPDRPLSKTLAYTAADMPATRPAAAVAAAQSGGRDSHDPAQKQGGNTVVGEGKVIATVPGAGQLVIEHGEIKGFMDSMTMGYRIDPPSLLEGLKFGDKVRFTIDMEKKTIVKIEKLDK